MKCYIWSIVLCDAGNWTFRKVDQKYLESSGTWCWRRMERSVGLIMWRMKKVWQRLKAERNILHAIIKRKTNWIGHTLRRNSLIKHITGRNLEESGIRGRWGKQLLDAVQVKIRYVNLKEGAEDRTLWRTSFGRGYGPVVRQTSQRTNFEISLRSYLQNPHLIAVH